MSCFFDCDQQPAFSCSVCNRSLCIDHDATSHKGVRATHKRQAIKICDLCTTELAVASCFNCPGALDSTKGLALCTKCFDVEHNVGSVAITKTMVHIIEPVNFSGERITAKELLDYSPPIEELLPSKRTASLPSAAVRKRRRLHQYISDDSDELNEDTDMDDDSMGDFIVDDDSVDFENSAASDIEEEDENEKLSDKHEDEVEDEDEKSDEDEVEDNVPEPSWIDSDDDATSTIHVPASTFVTTELAPTVHDISKALLDDLIRLMVLSDTASRLSRYLSPLAGLRLEKHGFRMNCMDYISRYVNALPNYSAEVLGLDRKFLAGKNKLINQWLLTKGATFAFSYKSRARKVWLKPLLAYYMLAEPDKTSTEYDKLIPMVFPILELNFLGHGWNRAFVAEYLKGQTPIHQSLKRSKPESPVFPVRPDALPTFSSTISRELAAVLLAVQYRHGPSLEAEIVRLHSNTDAFRTLSLDVFRAQITECQELQRAFYTDQTSARQQYDEDMARYYDQRKKAECVDKELRIWKFGQEYVSAVKTFRTYERTWTSDAGALKNLYDRLAQAWTRMQAKATNKRVLGRGIARGLSIMFNGVSDERTFGPLTEELARQLGPVLTVETVGGRERKTFSVPLMILKFEPETKYENNAIVFTGGTLKIYFRQHDRPLNERKMSKIPSIIVKPDGSCEGTRRGASLMPFLSIWDKQFARVSQTLGKLLGHCVFCRKRMSRKESLTRGSGDRCFQKYGISTGGLVLENTADDAAVANVQLDRSETSLTADNNVICSNDSTLKLVKLLVSDGEYLLPVDAPLFKASSVLKDMLDANLNGDNDETIIPLPTFIDKETVQRLNVYAAAGGKMKQVEDMVHVLRDIRAYDFLLVDCKKTVEIIGKSVGSMLAGRLDGLF